jgi:hypothetical protein
MAEPERAVIVHFTYGSTDLSRLFELENKLEGAIEEAKVGEYDGNTDYICRLKSSSKSSG